MRKFTSLFTLAVMLFVTTAKAQEAISIKDFIERADTETEYQLTGVVTSIVNTMYGNLYIEDETGSIYIYGLLTPEGEAKQFESLDVAVNDTLTLRGAYTLYGSTVEIKNATYVDNKKFVGQEDVVTTKPIKDVIAAGAGKAQVEGTVVATYARGFLVGDATGYILVYLNAAHEYVPGDVVTVLGYTTPYAGMLQFPAASEITKTGTATVTAPAIQFTERDMDDMLNSTTVRYGQYTGKLSISGSYYNVTVPDCQDAIGSISYPNDGLVDPAWDGKDITVTGYFIGTSSNKYFNTMAVSITCDEGDTPPVVDITNTPETAYTVAKAYELIAAGEGLATKVYVKGTVTEVESVDTGSYGNATFNIASEGSDQLLKCYRAYALNNEKFVSEKQVAVGDEVVMYGLLTDYNGTYEMAQGCYIYSTSNTYVPGTDPVEYATELTNGGFEQWNAGKPEGWTSVASNATISLSADAFEGESAVAVAGIKSSNKRFTSEILRLEPNTGDEHYLFTVYAKAGSDVISKIRLGHVTITDGKADSYIYGGEAAEEVTTEWTKYEYTFQLTEQTDLALIVMNAKNDGGDNILLVDNAALQVESPADGISTLTVTREAPVWFDLTGKRVSTPAKGIYIMQQGGKAIKTVIR